MPDAVATPRFCLPTVAKRVLALILPMIGLWIDGSAAFLAFGKICSGAAGPQLPSLVQHFVMLPGSTICMAVGACIWALTQDCLGWTILSFLGRMTIATAYFAIMLLAMNLGSEWSRTSASASPDMIAASALISMTIFCLLVDAGARSRQGIVVAAINA